MSELFNTICTLDFQSIFDFVKNNFITIIIGIGLVTVAVTVAEKLVRIIAVVAFFLLCLKLFFL